MFLRISQDLMAYYDIKYPLPEGKREMATEDWCRERVANYIKNWQLDSEAILTAMQNLFKLTFYRPVIDVYVAPFIHEQSTPLLFGTRRRPEEFIDGLTHELFHVLISDNHEGITSGKILASMFPELPPITRIHIIVHAGLKYIYLDVLKDEERLKRDMALCDNNPPYKEAWRVVETTGYMQLITEFTGHYS
jgi:hypothetical protein